VLGWGPQDVAQGDLGSCYFLATLGSIAHYQPHLIGRIFQRHDLWEGHHPVYVTRWLVTGRPVVVAVDGWFPAWDGWPTFASYGPQRKIWPMILEKAWAKIFGSYKRIESGFAVEAIKALTQAPVDILPHAGQGFEFSKEDLWAAITDAVHKRHPLVAGTGDDTTNNIARGHVYAVLGATLMDIDGTSHRVSHLFNPWAFSNYRGKVPARLNPKIRHGFFYMLFDEFLSAFGATTVARVRDGYSVSARRFAKQEQRISKVVEFDVASSEPFSVQLEWPSSRVMERAGCGDVDPRIFLRVTTGNVSVSSSRSALQEWANQPNVRVDLPGGPGTYTVDFFAEFPLGPWLREIVLNTYASETVTFKDVGHSRWPDTIVLDGFTRPDLNQRFTEVREEKWWVGNLATFWTTGPTKDAAYFLYWCTSLRQWAVAEEKDFDLVRKQDGCPGLAAAPKNLELVDPRSKGNWWENTADDGWADDAWVQRPNAGVSAVERWLHDEFSSPAIPASMEPCERMLDRLDELNNWVEILDYAADPSFPPEVVSIAEPGMTCGDSAQGIEQSCEYYNHWATIADIMANGSSTLKS